MRGFLKKIGVRRFVVCIALGAILLAGVAVFGPRGMYYLERANFHSAIEQLHRFNAQQYRRQWETRGHATEDFMLEMEEDEANLADQHAQLKKGYRRAAFLFWQCPRGDLPLPYPWDKQRDSRVLEAALLAEIDISVHAGDTFPESEVSVPRIIVDKSTTIGEFEDWYKLDILPGEGLEIHVAADLQQRNTELGVPVTEFNFSSRQIVIDDLDMLHSDALTKYPDAVGFVRVSLPGYSHDGRIALVAISNAVSNHPSGRMLALALSNGVWHVAGTDYFAGE